MESDRRRPMNDVPNDWNSLTEAIIGAAIEVHSTLGPGLLERFYEQAMAHELDCRRIPFQRQDLIRLRYKTVELGEQFIDLVVGGLVVVELKSVERVHDAHLAQLVAYMRSARLPLGLLINFNCAKLKDGLFRRVDSIRTPVPRSMLVEAPEANRDGRAASAIHQHP